MGSHWGHILEDDGWTPAPFSFSAVPSCERTLLHRTPAMKGCQHPEQQGHLILNQHLQNYEPK